MPRASVYSPGTLSARDRQRQAQRQAVLLLDSDGLHLQIYTSGSKLWRLRFRFRGKANMISLGAFPAVSLKEAREKRDAPASTLHFARSSTRSPHRRPQGHLLHTMRRQNKSDRAHQFLSFEHRGVERRNSVEYLDQIWPAVNWLDLPQDDIPGNPAVPHRAAVRR